ncbi:hypothetical protein SAMN06264849_11435 [Melghirimyces algeriensis]|uniref:Uncharacterized protein n=1 Tax=Melghirimyces algeriensis TaxID=910412 RepID=A0A521F7L2_9BACL|nr:hypothetical protein SAMN06264849_11435 [Melghirimyces algeriensis]
MIDHPANAVHTRKPAVNQRVLVRNKFYLRRFYSLYFVRRNTHPQVNVILYAASRLSAEKPSDLFTYHADFVFACALPP